MDRILVTGGAGFIGYHLCRRLLLEGCRVTVVDNLAPDYDPSLKQARVAVLYRVEGFRFLMQDLSDRGAMSEIFDEGAFDTVVHLAPLGAGSPGLINILEASGAFGARRLLYVADTPDRALAVGAHARLHGLDATGLGLFCTVYGPWGRPDSDYHALTAAILGGRVIEVPEGGGAARGFVYVTDVVERMAGLLGGAPGQTYSGQTYWVSPAGRHSRMELVRAIGECAGREPLISLVPARAGDTPAAAADHGDMSDMSDMSDAPMPGQGPMTGPMTGLVEGMAQYVQWYRGYHVGA